MQHQETYYDEEAGEYYVYAPKKFNMMPVYTVVYFLLLAIIVVPATRAHMGMQAIFIAMVAAAIVLVVCILLVKLVIKKLKTLNLTGKGFLQVMVGARPDTYATDDSATLGSSTVDSDVTQSVNRSIVPATPTGLIALEEIGSDGLPTRIIERDPVKISDWFMPSVRAILGAMILLCGIRRSGKSNLLAVLAEEIAQYFVPLVIFDTEDEYDSLANLEYMPNAVHVGSPEYRKESANPDNYVDLTIEGAYAFGRAILDGRLQVVVNLKSWSDDDAAVIMAEIIDGLNDWEEEHDNEDRLPVMLFLDEAQKWLPQQLSDKYVSDEHQTLLHHAFFDIAVARGGKRGFGLIVATQRYSQLNKNVLQSQWKFLLKQTEEIDVGKYAKQGLDPDDVRALQQGECFIFTPLVVGFKTTIRERYSPHKANTPGLDNLTRTRRQTRAAVLTRSFAGADVEVITSRPQVRRATADELLERGIAAYQEGYKSIDALATALDIKPWAARQLKPKIEAAIKQMEAGNSEE